MSPSRKKSWILWLLGSGLGLLLSLCPLTRIPSPSSLLSVFKTSPSSWNVLYHVGGNGPWIRKVDNIVDTSIEPPEGCVVEQVHMLSRHAERYPTSSAGGRMLDLLQHIKDSNVTFKGDLEFVNDWQYFSLYPLVEHDQLTTTGPYAGSLSAFVAGTRLRSRYLHLLDAPSKPNKTSFWASDCNRVIETARYFAIGFFGLDWSPKAKLHVVPETPNLGGNTLTPGDTCAMYRSDLEEGHDYGLKQLIKFRSTYLPAVSARFYAQNDGLRFSDGEIYSMQEMCGFETLVRGSSPWCEAFTQEDWLNFEYARDVIHYYRAGPGNPYGAAMGWLWLNATTNLLVRGPSVGQIFFSFVHDGDIVPMLAALNLLPSTHHLPVTHREASRSWKLSQVVPMNGRIIFERLHCDGSALPATAKRQAQPKGPRQTPPEKADPYKSSFVRININDGVVALPGCANGPGSSCAVEDFAAFVRKRGEEIGGFRETCGLGRNASARITFLHQ